jgi:hypothetical protein
MTQTKISIEVKGKTPLLMNKFDPAEMLNINANKARRSDRPAMSVEDQAEKAAYKMPGGQLYIPGAAFKGALKTAGGDFKLRSSKRSVRYMVPMAIQIPESCIYLTIKNKPAKKYEIDIQRGVNPKTHGAIVIVRPRLDVWEASFTIVLDQEVLQEDLVKNMLEAAGRKVGVGDYRVEKGGHYGQFEITKWKSK